jgi:hypothetical protein
MDWLHYLLLAAFLLLLAAFLLLTCLWRNERTLRQTERTLRQTAEFSVQTLKSYLFGTRWQYIIDFQHTYMQISDQICYENFASTKTTVFPSFCPTVQNKKVADKDRRTSVSVKSGILSESRPFEKAHLIPHSESCNASWKVLFEPTLRSFAKKNKWYTKAQLLDMTLYGFRDQNCDARMANTGIVHNPFNILGIADQFQGLDLTCVVALLPYTIAGKPVTMESILSWDGEELTVLVLPHSIDIGKGYFGFIQNDGKYLSEVESNDPKVTNSIDIFNEYSLMISGCLAYAKLEDSTENKMILCQEYRKFLKTQTFMPCLKVPSKAGMLKIQGFPSRRVTLPGRRRSSTKSLDFSAPHPFLLVLRAMNAWCDFLHFYQAWPEWTKHIQRESLLRKDDILRTRLVILPGCCDVSRYEPDCILCKCNCLITSPELYCDLPEDLLEKAKMFTLRQIALSMDSCDAILELKSVVSRPAQTKRKQSRRSSSHSSALTERQGRE